jgi:hypothetical protein
MSYDCSDRMKHSMGMTGEDKDLSPAMSDLKENNSTESVQHQMARDPSRGCPSRCTNMVPTSTSSATSNSGVASHIPSSTSAPSHLYCAASGDPSQGESNGNLIHTPEHSSRPLTAGPRPNPIHSDRPNSAPPHQLEKVSAAILRSLGDQYNDSHSNKSHARSWQMLGDQMHFEYGVRRVLSFSDIRQFSGNNK